MTGLPTGTVSMLFSDIEGSTLLVQRLGDRWPEVLGLQRRVCREAWARHGGHEIGTEGDSFFVVFASAESAVGAAARAQAALADSPWPGPDAVRVRMGVHTGTPILYDRGYAGLDVHRAARIAGAAHGGQVVVSEATATAVATGLPASVTLRDLGRHRLKDLPALEHLFQLEIAGLRVDFPPLKSLGASSTLPRSTTPLVGREADLARLESVLRSPEAPLVTLTGPGGTGKTRLAIGAAERVVDRFPGGVYFVPLAAVTSVDSMWATVAEVLNVPAEGRLPPQLFEHLPSEATLCVLDNLEQILEAGDAVAELLQRAASVTVLATSRQPLHLAAEQQVRVPPLSLPETVGDAADSGAVQLFVQRARQVGHEFQLTPGNTEDVVALCRRLDGLPLAIELAASRSNLLSPAALLARLGQGLDLDGTTRDRPDRQRTLRVTLDWSYRLLEPDHQRFFRLLGVFAGGADLDALAAVAGLGSSELDAALGALVDASLVTTLSAAGELRVGLLQTIRAYALDRLSSEGELADVRRRHAHQYLELARRYGHVPADRQQLASTLRWFETEHDNLRAALAWALPADEEMSDDGTDRAALGLRLCVALGPLWYVTGGFAEAGLWQESAIRHADGADSFELARCMTSLGSVLHEQARELDQAARFKRAGVEMWRRLGDGSRLAFALAQLGATESEMGEAVLARGHLAEALRLARESGESGPLSWALGYSAYLEACERNLAESLRLFDEAIAVSRDHGDPRRIWIFTMGRACTLRLLGRHQEAAQQLRALIPAGLQTHDPQTLAVIAECCVTVLSDQNRWQDAARLLGAADATRERLTTMRLPLQERDVREAVAAARDGLPEGLWEAAYGAGREIPVEMALAHWSGERVTTKIGDPSGSPAE